MIKLPQTINGKKIILITAGFAIGIFLLISGSASTDKGSASESKSNSEEMYYSELMEERLEDFLKTVRGIDQVRVFITVDGGNEYEYAQKGNSEGIASDYLIIDTDDGEEAAVVRQIYPQIRGIGVSCTGGDNGNVKKEITSLLSAALGISANKIEVTGYNDQS